MKADPPHSHRDPAWLCGGPVPAGALGDLLERRDLIVGQFLGGAAGSAAAAQAWEAGGWNAVSGLGVSCGAAAPLRHYRQAKRRKAAAAQTAD